MESKILGGIDRRGLSCGATTSLKITFFALGLLACKAQPDSAKTDLAADSSSATTIITEQTEPEFRRAVALFKADKFAEAQRAFEQITGNMQEYATYYAALSAANLADTVAADALFRKLPADFQREWAWRARVTAFEKAKAYARGSAVADSVAARLNGPVRRSEALLRSAQLHMAAKDSAQAMRAARLALAAAGNSPTGNAATDILARYARSNDDLSRVARAYYSSGRYSKAIPLLNRLNMTSLLGQAHLNSRQYDAAVKTLTPLAKQKNVQAQLLIARAHLRARNYTQAINAARAVTKLTKTGASAAAAYFLIADLADDRNDWKTAAPNYEAAASASPRSENGVNAYMRLGVHSVGQSDYKGAIKTFTAFREANAKTDYKQQATFWLAHTNDLAGNKEEATRLMRLAFADDPISYYGLLAGKYLKQEPKIDADGPARDAQLQKSADDAAERVHVLKDVGFNDASAFELYRVTQDFKAREDGSYALAEELIRRNEASSAIRLGLQTRTKLDSWNKRLLRIVFPMPFEDLIKREAKKHDVDPYLVAALIRQESTFDPNALSRVGAVGLMQVMPATANKRTSELKKPETNVPIGVAHLKTLIDQYKGEPAYLLAAYNAGQTPVGRWLKLPGASDPLLFVERIPYDETRGYAKIVQRNAGVYRMLYDR